MGLVCQITLQNEKTRFKSFRKFFGCHEFNQFVGDRVASTFDVFYCFVLVLLPACSVVFVLFLNVINI